LFTKVIAEQFNSWISFKVLDSRLPVKECGRTRRWKVRKQFRRISILEKHRSCEKAGLPCVEWEENRMRHDRPSD
jgi:hypothetical protein